MLGIPGQKFADGGFGCVVLAGVERLRELENQGPGAGGKTRVFLGEIAENGHAVLLGLGEHVDFRLVEAALGRGFTLGRLTPDQRENHHRRHHHHQQDNDKPLDLVGLGRHFGGECGGPLRFVFRHDGIPQLLGQ